MSHRRPHQRTERQLGFTILELMIVIAILGVTLVAMRSGLRSVTKADLSEDTRELAAFLRRASSIAIERGEQHRVVFDLDTGAYALEVCEGQAALVRNEQLSNDAETTKRAIERGQEKLRDVPADTLAAGDPDEAVKRATAIAGHHVADRACTAMKSGVTGDPSGKGWARKLNAGNGIKFKEIWVQHKDDGTTKGQIAIYFFPNGSSEKAVVAVADGDATRTVLISGLTGSVREKSGKLDDVDDHMLRNAMGDREKPRETQ